MNDELVESEVARCYVTEISYFTPNAVQRGGGKRKQKKQVGGGYSEAVRAVRVCLYTPIDALAHHQVGSSNEK